MSNFSEFEYGTGVVYGQLKPIDVTAVDIITPKLVKITYNTTVVCDPSYFDINSYSVVVQETGAIEAKPVRVLQLYNDNLDTKRLSSNFTLLVMDNLTEGTRYQFTVNGVRTTQGLIMASTPYSREKVKTKTQVTTRLLPSHFDTRPDSLIGSILTAITIQDDLIGGARKEYA